MVTTTAAHHEPVDEHATEQQEACTRQAGAQQASPECICEHPAGQLAVVFLAGMSPVQHIPPVQSIVCPTWLLAGAAAARPVLLLEPGGDLLHAGQLPPPGASSCLFLGRGRLLGARNVCLESFRQQLGCALIRRSCISILAWPLLRRGLLCAVCVQGWRGALI